MIRWVTFKGQISLTSLIDLVLSLPTEPAKSEAWRIGQLVFKLHSLEINLHKASSF